MKNFSVKTFRALTFAVVGLATIIFSAVNLMAQEAPPAAAATNAAMANQDLVRAYLAIQEQLHETQLALERNRQEAESAAGRSAAVVARRLNVMERFMARQREEDSRTVWFIALSVAGAGLLAALLVTLVQVRGLRRMAEMAQALPAQQVLQLAAGPDAARLLGNGPAEAGARLTETIERLQKRVRELEATAKSSKPADASPLAALLARGQELLGRGQAAEAVRIFDEALALAPNHAEALVKKGAALEKLTKLNDAIACYDRAIAADGSLTIAYLNKGAALNRLQRFNEALACYESALQAQDKAHTP